MKATYLVLDLETDGLGKSAHILEVGAIFLDDTLQELDRFETVIGCKAFHTAEPDAIVLHGKNNLLADCVISVATLEGCDKALAIMLEDYEAKPNSIHLVGNSVHFDRTFVRRSMPQTYRFLHHRQIDISGLLMVFKMAGITCPNLISRKIHRAMPDCEDSFHNLRQIRHWLLLHKDQE